MLPVASSLNARSGEALYTPRRLIGFRPAVRWIGFICFILTFVWLLSPTHIHYGLPPPPPPHPAHPPKPPTGVPDSQPIPPAPLNLEAPPSPVWEGRKNEVKEAFVHAYGGYKKHAFPHDELMPTSGLHTDKYNGWGVTLFDSLDTMWLMGLKTEFYEAMQIVKEHKFHITKDDKFAPFFETVIRYLGGLLSAYALSHEPVFLERADELGMILLPVFNTSSGLPSFSVHVETGETSERQGNFALFAEIASCQLEFKYLAKLTGREDYYHKVEKVMSRLYEENVPGGLFPEKWHEGGHPMGTHLTAGANADSGYEYLLKQWLLSGDERARDQYITSMNGIINNLLYVSPRRGLLYVTDTNYGVPVHRMEHLSCFLPGLFALGAHTLDLPADVRELHQWAAEGLANTCWVSYADQPSGLGPDIFRMTKGEKWVDELDQWKKDGRKGTPPGVRHPTPEADASKRDYFSSFSGYFLRPETVESLYLLWKTTGDVRWRERGYGIFNALERNARTEYGYAGLQRVDTAPHFKVDDMPSYFLAETLKYLYLLFDDADPLSLDKWVLNTEAHPLPVFSWTEPERKTYNISLSS